MGRGRDIIDVTTRVNGKLGRFGNQRDTIGCNRCLHRSDGILLHTGVHSENFVRTGCTRRLPLIGSALVMTVRGRCFRWPAMVECTSSDALSVARNQSRSKQHDQFRDPAHRSIS